jgi:hypothetical protein
MLAFVFAMITLQNVAPDPADTPAASLSQRLTGSAPASGFDGLDDTPSLGGATLIVGCTYGTPRLGPSLFTDASDLSRAFSAPECANAAPASMFSPVGFVPAALVFAPTFYRFDAPAIAAPQTTTFSLPASTVKHYSLQQLALPTEFRGGAGRATSVQVRTGQAEPHALTARRPQTR